MKYYETSYEDYLQSLEKFNLHPYVENITSKMTTICNLIFYGPSGVGKYSQVLNFLKKFSPSNLKYDKKITINTDKQDYTYQISDIHYEIDMQLLGCHSKMLWHELFYQIVDIITIKSDKKGFIVCKNFHYIHNELLEIFYSYIQQYTNINSPIQIYFIIITENVSFLPNNILNSCKIINMKRPIKEEYIKLNDIKCKNYEPTDNDNCVQDSLESKLSLFLKRTTNNIPVKNSVKFHSTMENINENDITNIKELNYLSQCDVVPLDIFNSVNDSIIDEMVSKSFSLSAFRDLIYDILIYNLDATECIWYIFHHFICNESLNSKDATDVLMKCNSIFLHYNNNYRPIYHLENILLYIVTKINAPKKSVKNIKNRKKQAII